jgi:hypothetical protein
MTTEGVAVKPLQWRASLSIGTKDLPPDLWASAAQSSSVARPEIEDFKGWTIENRAIAAVAELAAHPGAANWQIDCKPANWKDQPPERIQRELDMLEALMGYRDGVMSEAITQATSIIPYFQGLVGFTDASHPQTTNLCIIALNLGQFAVMLYKQQFNRPRPSQLRPALLPQFDVPGHASYPSGHSTESHLIAYVLRRVLEKYHPALEMLHPLADRIALNREVMGLHYRSDSEAGKVLAERIDRVIGNVAGHETIIKQTLSDATKEWNSGSANRKGQG